MTMKIWFFKKVWGQIIDSFDVKNEVNIPMLYHVIQFIVSNYDTLVVQEKWIISLSSTEEKCISDYDH